jgi:CRISPR-associated protein Cas1
MRRTSSISTPVAHLVGPGKLKVVNGQLAFSDGGHVQLRLDPKELRTLLCYGAVGITDEAFQVLFRHDVDVTWLTPAGTICRGRLVRADAPTTGLRLLQYRALQDEARRRDLAAWVVSAKVQSQAEAARHYQRHGCAEAGPVLAQLQEVLSRCAGAVSLDQLRGLEGSASASWFGLLARLLIPPWQFAQRVRRPPTDPVNALLSLGYTWLLTRTRARCEAAGLEVYLGALHEYRPGRPSLACDLMEPLRVPAVDRWVVTLCNRGQADLEDFVADDRGGIRLRDGGLGRMLIRWEEHWVHGGHEAVLEQLVQSLLSWFRQFATPGDSCEETDAAL